MASLNYGDQDILPPGVKRRGVPADPTQITVPTPPGPPGPPLTDPKSPPVDKTGNPEHPIDRPSPTPPMPPTSPRVVGPTATPQMPNEPTPIASQAPSPFTPMTGSMSASDTTIPSVVRRGVSTGGPHEQSSSLLGKAGGLMGGGLAVPGVLGTQENPDMADLLMKLFMMGNR